MLRLGVNVDHVATLRNARGGIHPDPLAAAILAIKSGADGITTHLREDRRHIRDADITAIRAGISAPLNFEMAATEEMVRIALATKPNACCLVPEKRTEVTTEGGLNVAGQHNSLRPMVTALRAAGIRVSLFVDADEHQLRASADIGADIVELHTGAYAHGPEAGDPDELIRLTKGANLAKALGLEVHAGHGLTYANVSAVAAIPEVVELNIGHFIIGQAVFEGLPTVIAQFRELMNTARA
jgi:pyridoxine 5-phosphate synthase